MVVEEHAGDDVDASCTVAVVVAVAHCSQQQQPTVNYWYYYYKLYHSWDSCLLHRSTFLLLPNYHFDRPLPVAFVSADHRSLPLVPFPAVQLVHLEQEEEVLLAPHRRQLPPAQNCWLLQYYSAPLLLLLPRCAALPFRWWSARMLFSRRRRHCYWRSLGFPSSRGFDNNPVL